MLRGRAAGLVVTLLAVAGSAAACSGPSINLKASAQLVEVSTGWYDAGIEKGKNKLVPSVTFKIQNVGGQPFSNVQLNAVYRVVGDQEELGSTYVRARGEAPLAPGSASEAITLRCQFGYTGEQPRAEMLSHSQFRDAKVEVFGKHGSAQWVRLGEYPIERRLLTGS
jgi:hypothetical protein